MNHMRDRLLTISIILIENSIYKWSAVVPGETKMKSKNNCQPWKYAYNGHIQSSSQVLLMTWGV